MGTDLAFIHPEGHVVFYGEDRNIVFKNSVRGTKPFYSYLMNSWDSERFF